MDLETNKRIVRRQFEMLNGGNLEGATNLWAPMSLNHGRKADRASLLKVFQSLHSLHERHSLHEMIAEGDWVAVRTTCTGIHSAAPELPVNGGIFTGVRPTGKSYTVQHLHLFRVVDGLLADHWATREDLEAARQVGLRLTLE